MCEGGSRPGMNILRQKHEQKERLLRSLPYARILETDGAIGQHNHGSDRNRQSSLFLSSLACVVVICEKRGVELQWWDLCSASAVEMG